MTSIERDTPPGPLPPGHPPKVGQDVIEQIRAIEGSYEFETFISLCEGPKLAMALEEHVKEYGVDIMNLQRAAAVIPQERG